MRTVIGVALVFVSIAAPGHGATTAAPATCTAARLRVAVAGLQGAKPPAGARLSLLLARRAGRAGLGIGPEGRCDQPALPPGYVVGGFRAS